MTVKEKVKELQERQSMLYEMAEDIEEELFCIADNYGYCSIEDVPEILLEDEIPEYDESELPF